MSPHAAFVFCGSAGMENWAMQWLGRTVLTLRLLCYILVFCSGSPHFPRLRWIFAYPLPGLFAGKCETKENSNDFIILWIQWKQIKKYLSTQMQRSCTFECFVMGLSGHCPWYSPHSQELGRFSHCHSLLFHRTAPDTEACYGKLKVTI